MPQSRSQHRVCPTRIDSRPVLVVHKVTVSQCQDRQRGQYHKCFTCAYNNEHVAKYGEPQVREGHVEPAPIPMLLSVPTPEPEATARDDASDEPSAAKAAS